VQNAGQTEQLKRIKIKKNARQINLLNFPSQYNVWGISNGTPYGIDSLLKGACQKV